MPSSDDLEALADAVREAARPERRTLAVDAGTSTGGRTDPGTGRRGHLPGHPQPAVTRPERRRAVGPPAGTVGRVRDLSSIVKAYDIRGVVPDQLDEQVARAVGAAFARVHRRSGRSSPRTTCATPAPPLAAAFAEGATGPGRGRAGRRARLDRPALLRLRLARPARRDVHRQPQPGPLQRDQAVPGRRGAGRAGHRPARGAGAGRAGPRRRRAPRGTGRAARPAAPSTRRTCAGWSTCPGSGR